jgi:hypothetical protein
MRLIRNIAVVVGAAAAICPSDARAKAPLTEIRPSQSTHFETVVTDPYAWLEDLKSQAVGDWLKAQKQIRSSGASGQLGTVAPTNRADESHLNTQLAHDARQMRVVVPADAE